MTLLVAAALAWVVAMVPVQTPPDPKLSSITIGSSSFTQQSLPLAYVQSWPVWMASGAGEVTLLPGTGASAEEEEGGWVAPHAFEQLWMPQDLPPLDARAAIGVVLKNGEPRYIFPCVEATVTRGNCVWHNRGLNTLPLAKTWLAFGDVPVDQLVVSCYRRPLPADESGAADAEEEEAAAPPPAPAPAPAEEQATGEGADDWTAVLPLTPVRAAVDTIFEVIGNAPSEMGDGFAFLVAPVPGAALPAGSVAAGEQLRLFLSDVDATPTALDPEDRTSWLWNRGECDLAVYDVAPGSASEFLPPAYRPLFA